MKQAATLDEGALRRLFNAETFEAVKGLAGDALALFGSLVLFLLYIVPVTLRPTVLVPVPNVLTFSIVLVVGSLPFVGMRAMRRTPFDYLFLVWMLMAVVSHVYATTALARQLPDTSLFTYLAFIAAAWASFRAGFALVTVSPRFGPIAIAISMLFILTCSATLSIFQGVGPFKQAAFDLAGRFSDTKNNLLEGAVVGRPTGMFGGPNILGYANCIGVLVLVAIGVTFARNSKPWHVLLIMATLGVFGYSTLLAQSRSSLVIYVLAVAAYGFFLRRRGASNASLSTFALLFVTVGLVGVSAFQFAKLSYVENTFSNDIQKDGSYLLRQKALSMAADIAVEVAPLGTGVGQANQANLMAPTGYDRYWTIGVDNEWVNIYLSHGVWGPALMAFFFVFGFRGALRIRKSPRTGAQLVGVIVLAILAMSFVISFTAVRFAKYETVVYTCVFLGAAFASADRLPRRPDALADRGAASSA